MTSSELEKIDYFLSLLMVALYIITAIVDQWLLVVMIAFQLGYGTIMGVRECIKHKFYENGLLLVALYLVSVALLWMFVPTIALIVKGMKKFVRW